MWLLAVSSRCALGDWLAQLPNGPEQDRRQDSRGQAVETEAAEVHHVAHADDIRDRRQAGERQKRKPDPASRGRKQQNSDERIKNGADISVGNAEWARERRVSDAFAAVSENGADEAPHEAALIEAHIEHGRGADGRNPEGDETVSGHDQNRDVRSVSHCGEWSTAKVSIRLSSPETIKTPIAKSKIANAAFAWAPP